MMATLRPVARFYSSQRTTVQLLPRYFSSSQSPAENANTSTNNNHDDQLNIVGGDGKNRIVVLGTGWAGFNLALKLKNDKAASPSVGGEGVPEVRIVSPSNHFVFTPLLPSTAVGTLEFR